MVGCVLLLVGCLQGQFLDYSEVELYKPMFRNSLAVDEKGRLFVLDSAENTIHLFDEKGLLVRSFGGKGNGPGEFQMAASLYLKGGKLYVNDVRKDQVSAFDRDGKFLQSYHTDQAGFDLRPVANGWVHSKGVDFTNFSETFDLMFVDDNFVKRSQIFSVVRHELDSAAIMNRIHQAKKRAHPYFVTPYGNHIAVRSDGKRIFVSTPQPFKIYVIDGDGHQVLHTIERDEPRVLFDEAYGEEIKAKIAARKSSRMEIIPQIPKYYPTIKGLACTVEGHLMVSMWTNQNKDRTKIIILDETGNIAKLAYKKEYAHLIFQARADDVWLSFWDDEEEVAKIVKCGRQQIDAAVTAYAPRLAVAK